VGNDADVATPIRRGSLRGTAGCAREGVAAGSSGKGDVVADRPRWQTRMAQEARAGPEFASFAVTAGPLLALSPRGDGHAVLVLPGLGGNDASTAPLRWFLARLGYRSYGWGLGANRGFGRRVTDGLDALLAAKHETGPVSLVGWSLGGVHAVELARRRPDAVRSIITLGSPLVGRRHPPAGKPTTSVYSRTDAVVSWRVSLLPVRGVHENVEVRGSHFGLGHNPAVAVVVADRLAQQPETWQPFQPPRWAQRWLPAT
jgi:pimeloyl-ACP methyl ester carboxylesterase